MKFRRDDTRESLWADWLSDDFTGLDKAAEQPLQTPRLADTREVRSGSRPLQSGREQSVFRSANASRASEPAKIESQVTNAVNISLTIGTPDFRKLQKRVLLLPWKRYVRIGVAAMAVLVLLIAGNAWLQNRRNAASKRADAANAPSYAPLQSSTPARQKSAEAPRYEADKQLYLFHDNYHGVPITVSQQPMPTSIKPGTSKLADIAQSMGATQKLDTTHGDVYYTQPEKTGAQRLVFVNGQTLIFVTSQGALSNKEWVDYIQNLE